MLVSKFLKVSPEVKADGLKELAQSLN